MLYIEDDEKIPFPDQPKRRNKKRKDAIKRPLGDISEKKIYRKEKIHQLPSTNRRQRIL